MDLKPLKRFQKSKSDFKLTKIKSKRSGSEVSVGQFEEGSYRLVEFPPMGKNLEQAAVEIVGDRMNSYLRTSAIVGIVDFDSTSTTFETLGGIYKLEKLNEA